MADLVVTNLSVDLGETRVLAGIDLRIGAGELVVVLGCNGAGKSTLLRAVAAQLPPTSGRVDLDGIDVRSLGPRARARRMAYLPQVRPLAWPLRVRDVIALGRFAHGVAMHAPAAADARAIDAAIESCALSRFADRAASSLSGGELSRVHVARAIASEAPLLLADEPVAALDPLHQFQIMTLLRDYADRGDNAVLVVLHEAALAARFADRIVWLKDAQVVADGSPDETLDAQRLRDIYGVEASVQREREGWSVVIHGAA